MTSPARRHFQRVTAALAAADAGEQPMHGDAYELMQAALFEDYRRLKATQSMERKAEIKREILPQYADYVAGVLERGQGAQDDVLMRVMLWRIDAGDLAGAVEIARYALTHGLNPPDQFERGTAAVIAEEVADQAIKQLEADDSDAAALLDLLSEVETLSAGADMHDQIRQAPQVAGVRRAHRRPARAGPAAPHAGDRTERARGREARPRADRPRDQENHHHRTAQRLTESTADAKGARPAPKVPPRGASRPPPS
ncbi:terminase [Halomonas sp. SS10-MC5]|uniref:phage terminase small subunit n=1 Tax=Halomonas sp. SS10-MC5 TaxID=2854257 RepID=UPI0018D1F6E9|nr:phage terminase small subunit [Halomonas sp. SS10-MC5]QPP50829.1 terminase [Halomonas sp. SS10-MC5]